MTRDEFIRDAAEEIKRQREALGLTRAEIATAIGVTQAAVRLWERGGTLMSAYAATTLRFYFQRKWAEREQQVEAEQQRTAQAEASR